MEIVIFLIKYFVMKTSDKFKKEKIFSFKPIAATNQTKSGLIKRTATKKEETTQSHPTRSKKYYM